MATVKTTCQQHPDVRSKFFFFMGQKSLKKKIGWCGCLLHTDLRKQFLEIARKNSPEPRTVYSFMTTAIVRALHILIFIY
jgi:hypothetical protein